MKTSGSFEQNLSYAGSYTGNITSMNWKNSGSSTDYTYQYDYDGLNRLTSGELTNGNGFAEYFDYDKHGNINYLVNPYKPFFEQQSKKKFSGRAVEK